MKKNHQQFIQTIVPAQLEWREGLPYSLQFSDVYFSKYNGLDETRYVFLQQNKLKERWQQNNEDFIIAETGFGTGLNFLAACQLWMTENTTGILHFVSVDKHPLSKVDLERALANWPELAEHAKELLEHYPMLTPGWHRLILYSGRIILTLFFGEVETFLADSQFKANAWFLDGFAPRQNQSMWSNNIYKNMNLLSAKGATFATYTAAGDVRRGLQVAGFSVEKNKGYANKRELLYGQLSQQSDVSGLAVDTPWFVHQPDVSQAKSITILGAGLAGAFTANKFAQQGYRVTVIEAEESIAQKASGNKQAMVYSRFSAYASSQYDFYHQAYLYSVACLKGQEHVFQTGLLELAYDDKSCERFEQLQKANIWPEELMTFLSAQAATDLLGMTVEHDAIHMHQGGYINPRQLCENLLSHKNITIQTACHVKSIQYEGDQWQLLDAAAKLIATTPLLILTTAEACLQFEQLAYLPLKPIRGQVTHLYENKISKRLQMPVCYEGYLAPSQNGEHSLGASFNLRNQNIQADQKDDVDNLNKLKQHLPSIYEEMQIGESRVAGSRVGFRCHSPDYLPVVGPLPDIHYFQKNYAGLRNGLLKKHYNQGKFIKGLFLNVAHGSRGVISAPLSAELLYSYVHSKGVFPMGEAVRHALHPARFLIKNIKRNQ